MTSSPGSGAEVIGISADSAHRQCQFAEKERVGFPMIGDESTAICRSYDVCGRLLGMAQRVTYVIDAEGRIEAVFHHELRIARPRGERARALSRSR